MKKRLMILGSLDEFVRLVQMAKERGIYTIVCDGYKGSPAKEIADRAYDIEVTHIEEIAEVCRKEQVDGIITSFSDLLFECMVRIAHRADLKCYLTPEALPFYRDKRVMKKMLGTIGVSTPRYTVLEQGFSAEELQEFRFPVVVKPVDKYGSRGVFVLDSAEKVRERFDEVCAFSDIRKILVEEYHGGYEFNMMTWVLDGKVTVISIADREKTPVAPEEIPISSRNVYPSRLYDCVWGEAREILQKVVDFTGQKEGALSMQFFWEPGGKVSVCEVAGRFLGYEHELVEIGSGFCMEELLLNYVYDEAALRRSLERHNPRMDRCCAVLYFHGRNKTIADQQKAREIGGRKDVVFSQIFYRDGETVVSHGPNPYVVRYYVEGADREEVDRTTEEIFARISIRDREGREILYRNRMTQYPD